MFVFLTGEEGEDDDEDDDDPAGGMSDDEDEQLAIERHNKLLEKARSVITGASASAAFVTSCSSHGRPPTPLKYLLLHGVVATAFPYFGEGKCLSAAVGARR